MANKDAAFGLRPVKMMGGASYTGGQSRYRVASGLSGKIFQGDTVKQVTGGGVERVGGTLTPRRASKFSRTTTREAFRLQTSSHT